MSELQNKYADLLGDPSRNLQREVLLENSLPIGCGIGFGISLSKCVSRHTDRDTCHIITLFKTRNQLEELKNSQNVVSTTETTNREAPKDEP
ncbi:hypothetical protein OIU76_024054 [Salix suchowensis]|nr:hypothetical protein OIU76_024054 [Salix suchowensis]